jgi:hypothetical protein
VQGFSLLSRAPNGGRNRKTFYLLRGGRREDSFIIDNDGGAFYIGYVFLRDGRFHLWRSEHADEVEVAVVKSLDEVIPAFTTSFETNPPRWERESATCYTMTMAFGWLDVKQDQAGQWVVYLNSEVPLLREVSLRRDGNPARFATREEAQHAAEVQVRDRDAPSERIDECYTWAVWSAARPYASAIAA